MPIVVIKILIALGLDQILGEPKRFHPLVGFGHIADKLENRLNASPEKLSPLTNPMPVTLRGIIAWGAAVLPFTLIAYWLSNLTVLGWLFDSVLLYLAIGHRSLKEHGMNVYNALYQRDLESARNHTGFIVSRDSTLLDDKGCIRATIESILENGNDSVFGALFWFICLGAPGVVMYRLSNTLDAMWGYRNERYQKFGWCAAKIDDALNYLPARVCALCFCLSGNTEQAFRCWKQQAALLSSPNGGVVMCAGAGALNIQLGGPAVYHGQQQNKPWFGGNQTVHIHHIPETIRLLNRALFIFIILLMLFGLIL